MWNARPLLRRISPNNNPGGAANLKLSFQQLARKSSHFFHPSHVLVASFHGGFLLLVQQFLLPMKQPVSLATPNATASTGLELFQVFHLDWTCGPVKRLYKRRPHIGIFWRMSKHVNLNEPSNTLKPPCWTLQPLYIFIFYNGLILRPMVFWTIAGLHPQPIHSNSNWYPSLWQNTNPKTHTKPSCQW